MDRTPTSHNTFVHVQVMRTLPAQMFDSHTHANTRGSSAQRRVACIGASKKVVVIHAQCPAYMPHLPQNTCARSLSPTSTIFRPYSPSLSGPTSAPWGLDQDTLRDPRRSGGYTKSASPTGNEPKLIQSDEYELQELNWTEILGQIRIKYQIQLKALQTRILKMENHE